MVRSLLIVAAVASLSVGCDRATKQIAIEHLAAAPPLALVGDTVRFELAANPGGLLSLGAGLPDAVRRLVFVVLVPVFVVLASALAIRSGAASAQAMAGVGAIVGGGLGNWIDRITGAGTVTDFVSLGFGGWRTGIFNVADLAILSGVVLLLCARSRPVRPGPGGGPGSRDPRDGGGNPRSDASGVGAA